MRKKVKSRPAGANSSLFTFFITFAAAYDKGEVLEWLKRHAWKACNRQNWFAGSNPVLSAKNPKGTKIGSFLFLLQQCAGELDEGVPAT